MFLIIITICTSTAGAHNPTHAFQPSLQKMSTFQITCARRTRSHKSSNNNNNPNHDVKSPSQSLFMKKNKYQSTGSSSSSTINIDEMESMAITASNNWDVAVTPFLNEHDLSLLKSKLDSRADVSYIPIGNIITSSSSSLSNNNNYSRTRLVMTNPDLVLDGNELEKECCCMLRIDHLHTSSIMEASILSSSSSSSETTSASSSSTSSTPSTPSNKSKPWPNLFLKIGIDLENVGEVVIENSNNHSNDTNYPCAYIIVSPSVVKQCKRLLPKELRGLGISISQMEMDEYIPYDGIQQDMELGVLDKRLLQYK
jgi:hypothetical protein